MPSNQIEAFLALAESAGWSVKRRTSPLSLNSGIAGRYPRIPSDYLSFKSIVDECVNPAQTAWFLTQQDYNADAADETTFRWNEWERISLQALEDDPAASAQVVRFWNEHLPIMSAVHSDYAYIAIRLVDGAVVYGYGPEFEDSADVVCASFGEYLATLGEIISGRESAEYSTEAGERRLRRQFSDFT